jgi:hypothetical protein
MLKIIEFIPSDPNKEKIKTKEGTVKFVMMTEYGLAEHGYVTVYRNDKRRWHNFVQRQTGEQDERGFDIYESSFKLQENPQRERFREDLFCCLDNFLANPRKQESAFTGSVAYPKETESEAPPF